MLQKVFPLSARSHISAQGRLPADDHVKAFLPFCCLLSLSQPPISQPFFLLYSVHREYVVCIPSQKSTLSVIPSHTIQSISFGDGEPLRCSH